MGLKSTLIKPFAVEMARRVDKWRRSALADQDCILKYLVHKGKDTRFGTEHQFNTIRTYDDFAGLCPILDYEDIKHYIEAIKKGDKNVLWPGLPAYFAKTSGTTSGAKYIPLTRESMPNHFNSARNALLNYMGKTGKGSFFDGKMIFLSGSPTLDTSGPVPCGRLSGIVNHEIPGWLRRSQMPSYETNCIEDWEEKVNAIVRETKDADMRLISGIPPWVQMYLERLLESTGKSSIADVFPNLAMFVYGGVNYAPYRETLEKLFGSCVDSVETFPASEGFFAFQDEVGDPSLLLNTRSGIYYEFVEADTFNTERPVRVNLEGVKPGVAYALIINSNAGLWGYSIGDVVTFTSVDPYKIVFSGRIAHFISAFGEHVIGKEIEDALAGTTAQIPARIAEFTVAPQVNPPEGGAPYHQWFIEFDQVPDDIGAFEALLNREMTAQNIYYYDLIQGSVLAPLKIVTLPKGSFVAYMKSKGKLGGQNKLPRLTNDRTIADELTLQMTI